MSNTLKFTLCFFALILVCLLCFSAFIPMVSAQADVVQISTFSQYVRATGLGSTLLQNLTNPFLSSIYVVYSTSGGIYRQRILMPLSLGIESSSRNPALPGQNRDYLYLSSKFNPTPINADTPNGSFVTDTRLYAVPVSPLNPASYSRLPYVTDSNYVVAPAADKVLFLTLAPVLSNTADLLGRSSAIPYGISFGTFTEDKSTPIAERCCYLRFKLYFLPGNDVLDKNSFMDDLLTFDYDLKFVFDATRIKPLSSTAGGVSTPLALSFPYSLVTDTDPASMQVFPGAASALEAYFNFVANANGYNQGFDDGFNQGHQEGYNEGYQDGIWEGENIVSDSSASYGAGYNKGFQDGDWEGFDRGYTDGKTDGIKQANDTVNKTSASYNAGFSAGVNSAGEFTFSGLIGAVLDGPVNAFMQFFNFEVFGVNLTGLLSALFVLCLAITILRLVLGG